MSPPWSELARRTWREVVVMVRLRSLRITSCSRCFREPVFSSHSQLLSLSRTSRAFGLPSSVRMPQSSTDPIANATALNDDIGDCSRSVRVALCTVLRPRLDRRRAQPRLRHHEGRRVGRPSGRHRLTLVWQYCPDRFSLVLADRAGRKLDRHWLLLTILVDVLPAVSIGVALIAPGLAHHSLDYSDQTGVDHSGAVGATGLWLLVRCFSRSTSPTFTDYEFLRTVGGSSWAALVLCPQVSPS